MSRSYRRRKIGGIASTMVRKRTKRHLRRNRRRHTQRGGLFGFGGSNGDDGAGTGPGVLSGDDSTRITKANAGIDDENISYALTTLDKGITAHTHTVPTTGGKLRRSKHRRSKHRRSKHRRRQRGGTKTTGVVWKSNSQLSPENISAAKDGPDSGNAFVDSIRLILNDGTGSDTAGKNVPVAFALEYSLMGLDNHTHTLTGGRRRRRKQRQHHAI